MYKKHPLSFAIALFAYSQAASLLAAPDEESSLRYAEEVTIIGQRENVKSSHASAAVVTEDELEIFHSTDINKILADIPGVYAADEEGWGLRPNIGIRGASTSRSSKITLLEDGVLVAPAPYSNPAAYYFPTTSRMVGVEVLKGAPILRYGPATVGGVLNLVSTPIPDQDFTARLNADYGSFNTARLLASAGGHTDNMGWLIEGQQYQSDGFHDIDRTSQDTGFDKQDLMAKFRYYTPKGHDGFRHQIDLKVQYAQEDSNMSYFGLTDADLEADPYRRYGLTELDNMDNDRTGLSMNYQLEFNDNLSLSVLAYHNEFNRDWFKVDKINGLSGTTIINEINSDGVDADLYQSWLDGTADIDDIDYKHNNRSYSSEGIQLELNWTQSFASTEHQFTMGVRDHHDDMDRFQPVESYAQIDGKLVFVNSTEGSVTGSNNRYETGDALSFWLVDQVQINNEVELTLSSRYESMDTSRKQYNDNDRQEEPSYLSNSADEWLFGAALSYELSDQLLLIGGVQEGMTPISGGSKPPEGPEQSTNYEFGFRFAGDSVNASVIGFMSDYSNTVQYCSNAFPCDNGETSGTLSLGESEVKGLEVSIDSTPLVGRFQLPLTLNYTYTDAKVTKSSDSSGDMVGDEWAYMPDNQVSFSAGVIDSANAWRSYVNVEYTASVCTVTGCNQSGSEFDRTESLMSVDWTTHYEWDDQLDIYFNVENILDETAIVSRSPYGARVNMPQTYTIGVDYKL